MKLVALALITAPALLSAQAPQAPKPGPEHQKLAYFAGRWSETADMKPGPMGPGGTMTGTSSCEWFQGGFYLVCRSNGRSPSGPAAPAARGPARRTSASPRRPASGPCP